MQPCSLCLEDETEQTDDYHWYCLLCMFSSIPIRPTNITSITFRTPQVSTETLLTVARRYPHLSKLSIQPPKEQDWESYRFGVSVERIPGAAHLPHLTDLSVDIPHSRDVPGDVSLSDEVDTSCSTLRSHLPHLTRLSFDTGMSPLMAEPQGPSLGGVFSEPMMTHTLRVLCTTEPLTSYTAELLLQHAPALEDASVSVALEDDLQPLSSQCRWGRDVYRGWLQRGTDDITCQRALYDGGQMI